MFRCARSHGSCTPTEYGGIWYEPTVNSWFCTWHERTASQLHWGPVLHRPTHDVQQFTVSLSCMLIEICNLWLCMLCIMSQVAHQERAYHSQVFLVFTSHVIKIKIITIQWKKSRVCDMIDDWYLNNFAKNQVSADFHSCVIRRGVSPKFIELCMETPCLCPSEGHTVRIVIEEGHWSYQNMYAFEKILRNRLQYQDYEYGLLEGTKNSSFFSECESCQTAFDIQYMYFVVC